MVKKTLTHWQKRTQGQRLSLSCMHPHGWINLHINIAVHLTMLRPPRGWNQTTPIYPASSCSWRNWMRRLERENIQYVFFMLFNTGKFTYNPCSSAIVEWGLSLKECENWKLYPKEYRLPGPSSVLPPTSSQESVGQEICTVPLTSVVAEENSLWTLNRSSESNHLD